MTATKLKQKLTLKQALFLKHFIQLGNASEAVRQAGYKTKNPNRLAAQLIANPIIGNELVIARQKIEKKVDVSLTWRMTILKQIAETGQDSDRIRSIAEINKMLGDYAPEKHHNTNLNFNATMEELNQMTNQYLDELHQKRLTVNSTEQS